jgi:hypothetical protein
MNRIKQLIENGMERNKAVRIVTLQLQPENRQGLSSDCTLNPMVTIAILMGGIEHPCDRCNEDRNKCRGFPRLNTIREFEIET